MTGIRCMLMRGGTSKGTFFLPDDVPADRDALAALLLRVMGSPDARQIDGLGGAHPLTSKVAVVSPAADDDADLDYLFAQVAVDTAEVTFAQTCGNILAGVVPFALERGLVTVAADGEFTARVRLLNTGAIATITVLTRDGAPVYEGDTAIPGVPGTAAPIRIRFAGDPDRALLPSGEVRETIDGHEVTLVDAGMPVVLLRASEFGVAGHEAPDELEARPELKDALERIRLEAGERFGLGNVSALTVPKLALLSEPRSGGAISSRIFIPHRVHQSIGVLMATSIAAGVRIPGAVGSDLARLDAGDRTVIEHPSGSYKAVAAVAEDGDTWRLDYSANTRTARKIFDGAVFPAPA